MTQYLICPVSFSAGLLHVPDLNLVPVADLVLIPNQDLEVDLVAALVQDLIQEEEGDRVVILHEGDLALQLDTVHREDDAIHLQDDIHVRDQEVHLEGGMFHDDAQYLHYEAFLQ